MIDPEIHRRLRVAREYIDDCFDSALRLEQIADQACFSEFHFQRLFRQMFHQTPHQYMTGRRLERARELLLYTNLPVSEICLLVGFQSLGSFSTLFSRQTGMSPSAYRSRFGTLKHFRVLCPDVQARIPACFLMMYGSGR